MSINHKNYLEVFYRSVYGESLTEVPDFGSSNNSECTSLLINSTIPFVAWVTRKNLIKYSKRRNNPFPTWEHFVPIVRIICQPTRLLTSTNKCRVLNDKGTLLENKVDITSMLGIC